MYSVVARLQLLIWWNRQFEHVHTRLLPEIFSRGKSSDHALHRCDYQLMYQRNNVFYPAAQ
jgi:hypothetical protein